MSIERALDRNYDDSVNRGSPGRDRLQGQDQGAFAAQSPSGYADGRSRGDSPQGPYDVNRRGRQEGGHGRRDESHHQGGRPRSAEVVPQFMHEHHPGAHSSNYYPREGLFNWPGPADAYGGYGDYGGQGQGYQQSQGYQHQYPALGAGGQRLGGQQRGSLGGQQQQQQQHQQQHQQHQQHQQRQHGGQQQQMQDARQQMPQANTQHRAGMAAARSEPPPPHQRCGALLSEVSASTADPNRVLHQHPVGGSQSIYSDPLGARKVMISAEKLADENEKPVLQEGEALSDARDFPLLTESGKSTGLDKEIIWLLHYWAQGDQGILLEFGCPGNTKEFTSGEVYHSLCALLARKGYDPNYVMATDMPTGNWTGPWKTSVAGKVALELALEGSLTVFPTDSDGRDPLELTVHILDNEGFQIHAERARRPPMTEHEKEEKRRHRLMLYAELPAEMLNVRPDVYTARLTALKNTASVHFGLKGAVHVGFCQARDTEGNGLNRIIIFVQIHPEGLSPKEFAAGSLPGTKYIECKCKHPAKLKLAKTGEHGLTNCCFREKCTPGVGPRGATSCDAANYYMDSQGVQRTSAFYDRAMAQAVFGLQGTKRPIDTDKEEAKAKSAASIAAAYEMHHCVQVCRAFERGRCVKHHEASLLVGDPRRCSEEHDKPKSEIKCCSILVPGDEYYHERFTKCRYKSIGEPCQYMCNNEST